VFVPHFPHPRRSISPEMFPFVIIAFPPHSRLSPSNPFIGFRKAFRTFLCLSAPLPLFLVWMTFFFNPRTNCESPPLSASFEIASVGNFFVLMGQDAPPPVVPSLAPLSPQVFQGSGTLPALRRECDPCTQMSPIQISERWLK